MATLFLAFIIISLALVGLAIGVMFGRSPVKGSCGGLACAGLGDCEICPHRKQEQA